MPPDQARRQPELCADLPNLVLEEIAQRLEQLEMHLLWQTADVVMRLDQVRLAGRRARRFDHVGIDRALREPANIFELRGLALEDLDEHAADDLALLLGISDARER